MYKCSFLTLLTSRLCTYPGDVAPPERHGATRFSYLSTQPTETVELDPVDTSGVTRWCH